MPGCRQGKSTTSCSRTSWWICTYRCKGVERVHHTRCPAHSLLRPQSTAGTCYVLAAYATPTPWTPTSSILHNDPSKPPGARGGCPSLRPPGLVHSKCSVNMQMMRSLY